MQHHDNFKLRRKEDSATMFCPTNKKKRKAKRVYVDFYGGEHSPEQKATFSKSDVAQDGCTVLCRAKKCYKVGIHRCAACEMASYCCEECRATDRPRHHEDCRNHTIESRIQLMRDFRKTQQEAKCQGLPDCTRAVNSFCRNCQAPACHEWACAKYHLDHCVDYLEFLSKDWVMVENDEEAWVIVAHERSKL